MADKITQAEYEIMSVLWRDAPLAASDVAKRLSKKKDWSDRTVKTLLSRLTDKNAVEYQTEGRRYLYSPVVSREAYTQRETKSLLDRVFGGKAAPLVAQLAENGDLDADDMDEILALIEEYKTNDR